MSNTVGGNIETKEIGLRISDSGTHENTEILDGKLVLSKVDEITYHKEGSWTSDVIDLSDGYIEFGKLFATYDDTNNASIAILTRTSNNGITFDEWIAVGEDGSILSNKQQYIQVKINLFAGYVNQEVVISNFDNVSEKEKFIPNEYINTENGLKLGREYVHDLNVDESWVDEGSLYRLPISRDEWSRIDRIEVLPSDVESKSLIYHDGEYKKYIITIPNQLPKWITETNIQNGSTDKIQHRQPVQLSPISMEVKSGILSEDDNGTLYGATVDLNKYFDIKKMSVASENESVLLLKENKFYSIQSEEIQYDINKMTSPTSPSPYAVKASSYISDSNNRQAFKAFDGAWTAFPNDWMSLSRRGVPEWIEFDFGKETVVNKLGLVRCFANSGKGYPPAFTIRISNDGIDYTDIARYENQIIPPNRNPVFYSIPQSKARIFRIQTDINVGMNIGEIYFYNSKRTLIQSDYPMGNMGDIELGKINYKSYVTKSSLITIDKNTLFVESDKKMAILKDNKYFVIDESGVLVEIQQGEVETLGFNELKIPSELISVEFEIHIHNPLSEEVIIMTEKDEFTFYDEFDGVAEILHYTTSSETSVPMLTIEANWSPLDELEGDFEVVTLANDETPIQLKIDAIPTPQFIHLVENVHVSNISNFTNIESSDSIRYLIKKDNTWYTFNGAFVPVDVSNVENIKSQGMTIDILNGITNQQWFLFDAEYINIGVYLEDDIRDNYISKLNKLSLIDYLPLSTKEITKSSFYILNTTARIDVVLEGVLLRAILSDADLGRVQYRVLLNNQPYRYNNANEEGWSELLPSPYNINMNLYDESVIIPNDNNTVRIEFRDAFGTEDYWESIFYAKKQKGKFTYAFIM